MTEIIAKGSVKGVVRFGEVVKAYTGVPTTEFVPSVPTPVVDESRTSYRW